MLAFARAGENNARDTHRNPITVRRSSNRTFPPCRYHTRTRCHELASFFSLSHVSWTAGGAGGRVCRVAIQRPEASSPQAALYQAAYQAALRTSRKGLPRVSGSHTVHCDELIRAPCLRRDRIENPDRAAVAETAPLPEIRHIDPSAGMNGDVERLRELQAFVVFTEERPVVGDRRAASR